MRRGTLRACAALLTFAVGVGCASLWSAARRAAWPKSEANCVGIYSAPGPPEVPFCKLMSNVDEYEGREVRVRAVYRQGIHGPTVGGADCSAGEPSTYVTTSPLTWDEIQRLTADAYGVEYGSGPVEIVAVGRLRRNNPTHSSDAWADRLPLRFELERIEQVTLRR